MTSANVVTLPADVTTADVTTPHLATVPKVFTLNSTTVSTPKVVTLQTETTTRPHEKPAYPTSQAKIITVKREPKDSEGQAGNSDLRNNQFFKTAMHTTYRTMGHHKLHRGAPKTVQTETVQSEKTTNNNSEEPFLAWFPISSQCK